MSSFSNRPRAPNGAKLPTSSWEDIPDPLPAQRPRPLTPPLLDTATSHPAPDSRNGLFRLLARQPRQPKPSIQRTFEQRQSPLLQLPIEIRLMVWEHYLGGNNQLHIVRVNRFGSRTQRGRLVGIKCGEDSEDFCVHDCWGKIITRKRGGCLKGAVCPVEPRYYLGQFGDSSAEEVNFVALLRTCRLVYTEVVDLIYRRTTFAFDHIDSIVNFSRTVLPQRLDRIRSVRLTYHFPELSGSKDETCSDFASACVAISRMSNLEELIIHCHPERYLKLESPLVQNLIIDPLRRIRHPNTLVMRLFTRDTEREMEILVEHVPFRLVVHNFLGGWPQGCGKRRLR